MDLISMRFCTGWGGHLFRRFRNMFSESSPCLLGQHGSCSTAQQPGNSLKTCYETWPPHLVCNCNGFSLIEPTGEKRAGDDSHRPRPRIVPHAIGAAARSGRGDPHRRSEGQGQQVSAQSKQAAAGGGGHGHRLLTV